eukprot:TRINITY_DN7488_c0_g4_i1.p1 TRINITY_DN7488_c0_g4~~TRINITY_DN7488_c0_g4_i1.p1  ORF type:complete len:877 (+),score=156.41 TRINITY_DN7488_c0_g4_i1:106-2631(+)
MHSLRERLGARRRRSRSPTGRAPRPPRARARLSPLSPRRSPAQPVRLVPRPPRAPPPTSGCSPLRCPAAPQTARRASSGAATKLLGSPACASPTAPTRQPAPPECPPGFSAFRLSWASASCSAQDLRSRAAAGAVRIRSAEAAARAALEREFRHAAALEKQRVELSRSYMELAEELQGKVMDILERADSKVSRLEQENKVLCGMLARAGVTASVLLFEAETRERGEIEVEEAARRRLNDELDAATRVERASVLRAVRAAGVAALSAAEAQQAKARAVIEAEQSRALQELGESAAAQLLAMARRQAAMHAKDSSRLSLQRDQLASEAEQWRARCGRHEDAAVAAQGDVAALQREKQAWQTVFERERLKWKADAGQREQELHRLVAQLQQQLSEMRSHGLPQQDRLLQQDGLSKQGALPQHGGLPQHCGRGSHQAAGEGLTAPKSAWTQPWVPPAAAQGPAGGRVLALNEELKEIDGLLCLTDDENAQRAVLVERVQRALRRVAPGVEAELYGSWPSGIALPGSDLDFCLRGINVRQDAKGQIIKAVEYCLAQDGFVHVNTVLDTAVPVTTFRCPQTQVPIDVSLASPAAARATTHETQKLLSRHAGMRFLVTVVKLLLLVAGKHKTHKGGLASYATALMAGAWCARGVARSREALLSGFLWRYSGKGDFDWTAHTIDPLAASGLDAGRMPSVRPGSSNTEWSIRDPANRENNVAAGCWGIHGVQQHFVEMTNRINEVLANAAACGGPGELPFLEHMSGNTHEWRRWVARRRQQLGLSAAPQPPPDQRRFAGSNLRVEAVPFDYAAAVGAIGSPQRGAEAAALDKRICSKIPPQRRPHRHLCL